MTFGWYIFHVILYQLFNVSNLSLYNQDRNWVAFQYSSVVSQSPSDHTTSGLYLLTISYSSGIVFVCKIKAKKYKNTTLRMIKNLFFVFFFKHYKCEGKYFELKECKCKLFFYFKAVVLIHSHFSSFITFFLLIYPDKVLCCIVVGLVFFIQGMIPLKQRVIQTKMYISLAPYRVGQFT